MPFSAELFDSIVENMLTVAQPELVLDIGAGAGKYGVMLSNIEKSENRKIEKVCVEADLKVINRFGLSKIYDKVIHFNAAKLIMEMPTLTGDIAIHR